MAATANLGKVCLSTKGIWNDQVPYDKLDLVFYQGSSYISKQDVPAGTALTNTSYWQPITGTLADQPDLIAALNAKAPLASPALTGTPTAPTAAIGTNNTQVATTEFVTSHDDFKITGTVSSGSYTLTDSRINNEHWEVDWIYFETASNVVSKVNWSTNITSHTVTLSATYAGSTNVVVNMHWVQ